MTELQLDSTFVGYTISSATLRLQDLIPAGLEFMASFDRDGLEALNKEYLDDINKGLYLRYQDMVSAVQINGHGWDNRIIISIKHISELGNIPGNDPIWDYVWKGDVLSWLWCESIFDRLDSIAPAGCWFSSHEGDGALFGFWEYGDD